MIDSQCKDQDSSDFSVHDAGCLCIPKVALETGRIPKELLVSYLHWKPEDVEVNPSLSNSPEAEIPSSMSLCELPLEGIAPLKVRFKCPLTI